MRSEEVRLPASRLVVWLVIVGVTVDLLFFSGTSNFLASPQARIVNQLVLLGSLLALAVGLARMHVDPRSPLLLPGLAWVSAWGVATAFSQRLPTSLEAMGLLLLAAPTYLCVRWVVWTDWLRPRLDRLIVWATFAMVAAYGIQVAFYWGQWWSVAGLSVPPLRPADAGLTIGTVNAVALHLELLVPVASVLAWFSLGRRRLSVAILAGGVLALVVTGSRGGWLGAVAIVGVFLVGAHAAVGLPRVVRLRALPRRGLVVAAGGLLVAAVLLVPTVLTRIASSDGGRLELWDAAWRLALTSPLVGTGPGTFPQLRPMTVISSPSLAVLTTSHEVVLQLLVDVGVLGLLAAVWLAITVARTAVRSIGDTQETAGRLVIVAAVASLAGMVVHALVDPQTHVPAVVLLVFWLVALLDRPVAPAPVHSDRRLDRRPVVLVGVIAFAVTGVAALAPVDVAMGYGTLGALKLNEGSYGEAFEDYRTAAGLHELAPYRLGEGLAAARMGNSAAAEAAFTRAQQLTPFTFILGNRFTTATRTEQAMLLDELRAMQHYDPTADVNAAWHLQASDEAAAVAALASGMVREPTLIFSRRPETIFTEGVWLQAQAAALDEIALRTPAVAAAVASYADMPEVAARYTRDIDEATVTAALLMMADAASGSAPDEAAARALLRRNPASQDMQQVMWLLGFRIRSQALIDDVAALSLPAFYGLPRPPMEIVVDGAGDATYSSRVLRYPAASDFRLGPGRPYAPGMLTIEPVYRNQP